MSSALNAAYYVKGLSITHTNPVSSMKKGAWAGFVSGLKKAGKGLLIAAAAAAVVAIVVATAGAGTLVLAAAGPAIVGAVTTGAVGAGVVVASETAKGAVEGAENVTTEKKAEYLPKGSPNVFYNDKPAIRRGLDKANCKDHKPVELVAQGSATVFVNNANATRKGEGIACGGIIQLASPNVFIGGATVGTIKPEPTAPTWLVTGLKGVAPVLEVGSLILNWRNFLKNPKGLTSVWSKVEKVGDSIFLAGDTLSTSGNLLIDYNPWASKESKEKWAEVNEVKETYYDPIKDAWGGTKQGVKSGSSSSSTKNNSGTKDSGDSRTTGTKDSATVQQRVQKIAAIAQQRVQKIVATAQQRVQKIAATVQQPAQKIAMLVQQLVINRRPNRLVQSQ